MKLQDSPHFCRDIRLSEVRLQIAEGFILPFLTETLHFPRIFLIFYQYAMIQAAEKVGHRPSCC